MSFNLCTFFVGFVALLFFTLSFSSTIEEKFTISFSFYILRFGSR